MQDELWPAIVPRHWDNLFQSTVPRGLREFTEETEDKRGPSSKLPSSFIELLPRTGHDSQKDKKEAVEKNLLD